MALLPTISGETGEPKTASKGVDNERQGYTNNGAFVNNGGVSNNGQGVPAVGYYCMPFYANGRMPIEFFKLKLITCY
jgi:hypothetical protein